jgi:oligopeptide/dipeptide ABC transporter ATP-binding protein
MYLGRAVESGPTEAVFRHPRHPYTRMLLDSVPLLDPARERARLAMLTSSGDTPSSVERPGGCSFHTRCPASLSTCAATSPEPEQVAHGHEVACLRWRDIVKSS